MIPQLFTRLFCLGTLILFLSAHFEAQDFIEPCASDAIHENLLYSDPIYERSFFYLTQKIKDYQHGDIERSEEIFTLPIVVHIIHEGEPIGIGSNISEEQIQSAISDLNDAFRKTPGSPGDGDGADVEVEFCMASRDPDGNPSTGIIRVDGSSVTDYAEMGIESNTNPGADEEDVKALSTWPREDYINIWIVNEIGDNDAQGGVQGYAYFPVASPVDGIVVLHNSFGLVGNLKPNTDENKTITHEMGHCLGLYHTFHATNSCEEELNCESDGDNLCDTPVTTINGNCSSPACGGTQLVENYMDYTSESCKDMFTEGQKTRMRAVIETDRATLLNSLGCVSVSDNDSGISAIISPSGMLCQSSIQGTVILTNYGSNVLNSVDIEYGLNGNLINTYEWSGTLDQGQSIELTLPIVSGSSGGNTYSVATNNPNGIEDDNTSNDELERDFSISTGAPMVLEVSVDFFGEETTWEVVNSEGTSIAYGGPYINNNQGYIFEENICAATGCYDLIVYDDFGDGMSFTDGSYTMFDSEGIELVSGGGNFGDFEMTNFCFTQVEAEGSAPVAGFSLSDASICEGANIDFIDTSGDEPTEWDWSFEGGSTTSSTAQNPQNIYFNTPGDYEISLTVSNEYGTDTYSMNVTVSPNPEINLVASSPTCYGLANGSINATVSSVDSYSTEWNNGSSNEDLNNIGAGTYTLTVETTESCFAEESVSLSNPLPITLELNGEAVSCFGMNDGYANSIVENGVGSINYDWSNNGSGSSISNLTAGNYSLLVTDENGCEESESITIESPEDLSINLETIDILCEGTFGSASISPEGGNGSYQINWSTGSTSNSISNLEGGTYSVSVSDALGCTKTENFEIGESANLLITIDSENISCNGLTDGSASVEVTGATGTITYVWSTGSGASSIDNLTFGTYSLEVEDANGCTGSADVQITQPDEMEISLFKSDITCHGLSDGSSVATTSGGTGTIEIEWSSGQNTLEINNLGEGIYTAVVTDENGCTTSEEINIIEPSTLVLTAEVTQNETCAGSDGSAVANAMGGTLGIEYYWSNGATEQEATELSAGLYQIVVTDGNGCNEETAITIEFDCDLELPTTQIAESDCEEEAFYLYDIVTCDVIESAELYQWKFVNSETNVFSELFTLGSNNECSLQLIDGLYYNSLVYASVRVLVSGNWSAYGDECILYTHEETPSPQFSEGFCELESITLGENIYCDAILGNDEYEWVFYNDDEEVSITTFYNVVLLAEEFGISNNTLYNIKVRTKVGPNWSDFSDVCDVVIGTIISTNDLLEMASSIDIFPNPNSGDKIFIENSNLSSKVGVSQVELFNSEGRIIDIYSIPDMDYMNNRIEIKFKNTLSPGMYVLRINLGDYATERKLIVR